MKYKIYALVFALSIIPFTAQSAGECSPLTRSIVRTTVLTSIERAALTQLFAKENIVLGAKPQDIFLAIGKFQKKYGLEVVGTVGPKTRIKINERIAKGCMSVAMTATATVPIVAVATPTPSVASPSVMVKDMEPEKLDLLSPDGSDNIIQGMGRGMSVVWFSKNISADSDIVVDLVGENLDSVIRSWKTKNTGKFELNHDEVDGLPDGYYRVRIRHFCNSATIPCSQSMSLAAFIVYPSTGYVTGIFLVKDLKSGDKFTITDTQSVPVSWYEYEKGFDFYKVFLGNVALNKEVFVGSTRSASLSIKNIDLKNLKKDMTKTEFEIQNSYYIKVQVGRRHQSGNETIIKETVGTQFAIRN